MKSKRPGKTVTRRTRSIWRPNRVLREQALREGIVLTRDVSDFDKLCEHFSSVRVFGDAGR